MPVNMPRVTPGQLITASGFNALAAEIEALHQRIDKLPAAASTSPVVTTGDDTPSPVVGVPQTTIKQVIPYLSPPDQILPYRLGEDISLIGTNFGTPAAKNKVEVLGATPQGQAPSPKAAVIKSGDANNLHLKLPTDLYIGPWFNSRVVAVLRLQNQVTGSSAQITFEMMAK